MPANSRSLGGWLSAQPTTHWTIRSSWHLRWCCPHSPSGPHHHPQDRQLRHPTPIPTSPSPRSPFCSFPVRHHRGHTWPHPGVRYAASSAKDAAPRSEGLDQESPPEARLRAARLPACPLLAENRERVYNTTGAAQSVYSAMDAKTTSPSCEFRRPRHPQLPRLLLAARRCGSKKKAQFYGKK